MDESHLDQWDRTPPYPIPSDHQFSPLYITNLIDVMHGRRLREHRKEQALRMEMLQSTTLRELKRSISRVFDEEMETWRRVQGWVESDGHSLGQGVHFFMADHYMQWVARRAKALYDELEALMAGRNAHNTLINSRHVHVQ